MLNDKTRADWEQGEEAIVELMPNQLKRLYDKLVIVGFGEDQALSLLHAYIVAWFGNKGLIG